MVLNFWHERNKRLAEARAEGRAIARAEIERARAERRAEIRAEIEKALAEMRVERRAEIRAEAIRETHAQWTAWNTRRIESEKRGEQFNEPPPSLNGR